MTNQLGVDFLKSEDGSDRFRDIDTDEQHIPMPEEFIATPATAWGRKMLGEWAYGSQDADLFRIVALDVDERTAGS